MKRIEVRVPSGHAETVAKLGEEHGGFSASHHPVHVEGEAGWSRVAVNLPNASVGNFLQATDEAVEDVEFVIPASETMPVEPPLGDVRDQVARVTERSTYELVLDVLQTVGTWKSLLIYAVVSGVVAAYGVVFGVSFLLTAAMLIAPLGAPAMVGVVGITVGDPWMLRRGAIRFAVALLVLCGAAAAFGLLHGLERSTPMMELVTSLSRWSALVGLLGGAAGAQTLVQAERDSMVTATATGFLVAVSLAPPAAVLGLSLVIGRWDYATLMAFLLLLTVSGVLVGGWGALTLAGAGPGSFTGGIGSRRARRWMVGASAAVVVGLVFWQAGRGPTFRKADLGQRAARIARAAVDSLGGHRVLASGASFTPGSMDDRSGEALVVSLVLTAESGTDGTARPPSPDSLRSHVTRMLAGEMKGIRPFVDLTFLPSP